MIARKAFCKGLDSFMGTAPKPAPAEQKVRIIRNSLQFNGFVSPTLSFTGHQQAGRADCDHRVARDHGGAEPSHTRVQCLRDAAGSATHKGAAEGGQRP